MKARRVTWESESMRYSGIARMQFFFFLVATFFLACPAARCQQTDLVLPYLEKQPVNRPDYLIIQINRGNPTNRVQEKRSFIRALGSSYFIVSAHDTTSADQVIGSANNNWKLPSLSYAHSLSFPSVFFISLKQASTNELPLSAGTRIIRQHDSVIEIFINSRGDFEQIIRNPNVLFIKSSALPKDEAPNSFQDLSVNRINFLHHKFPDLRGQGFTAALKERAPDTTDIDLRKRLIISELADQDISLHANMIATIIAGGGNSQPTAKGAATASMIVSTSYDNIFPDDNAVLNKYNVTVQNHSYGTDLENFYGPEAAAYDQTVIQNPTRIHVFSSGNSGQSTSMTGPYTSIPNFANLTGNMKHAKNVLTVGAHYEDMTIDARNSRGPSYDGRIKPELTAFGPEGTSDGAAFVSGTCLLLQQRYKQINGSVPTADIVKGALAVTAEDIGPAGIDYVSGFGAINAYKAVKVIDRQFVKTGTLSPGELKSFLLELPAGVAKLKAALTWIDPPAVAGAPNALMNDLDLKIKDAGNTQWLPWILNPYPHPDSLSKNAKRGLDRINNVEFVSVDAPSSGQYQLEVKGFNIQTPSQSFALTYWMEMSNSFEWVYPTIDDPAESGKEIFFRWETTYTGEGTIDLLLNNVHVLSRSVSLKDGFYSCPMPEGNGIARAIMKINGQNVDTVDFVISPALTLNVEFNCDDENMISWNSVSNAERYSIFRMGTKYLEQIASTSDTSFMFSENPASTHYAVEPEFNGIAGMRSAAYDIDNQGVNCYYSNFLAEATDDGQGRLLLNLSTKFNMDEIVWQKLEEGSFVDIAVTEFDGNLQYVYNDSEMKPGVTLYRATIKTKTDELIYTDVATVFYADERTYALFPNPVERESGEVNIVTDAQEINLKLFDRTGHLVKQEAIPFSLFRINVSDLTPGLYLYSVHRRGSLVSSGRLIIK